MKLKKGSKEAKAYMAKIRAKRGKAAPKKKAEPKKKVAGYEKTIRKGTATSVLYSNTAAAKKKAHVKSKRGKLFGAHNDTKSHNVNIRVLSGSSKISLNDIGAELLQIDFDLQSLLHKKKAARTITEKKSLAALISVKKLQHKTLKAYLNSRAKFV